MITSNPGNPDSVSKHAAHPALHPTEDSGEQAVLPVGPEIDPRDLLTGEGVTKKAIMGILGVCHYHSVAETSAPANDPARHGVASSTMATP